MPTGKPTTTDRSSPTRRSLPIDPTTDVPPGYEAAQRGQPGGFVGDPDVMDTWATSSLTPQIACGWEDDAELLRRDLPDGPAPAGARDHPDLAVLHHAAQRNSSTTRCRGRHTTFNGWILDPDRKKMSKSKGNVVTPMACSTNSVPTRCATGRATGARGWTPRSTPAHEDRSPARHQAAQRVEIRAGPGRRSRSAAPTPWHATRWTGPCWHGWPTSSRGHVGLRGVSLPAGPGDAPRLFFWSFCDDYVELVKSRAYGDGDPAGRRPRGPPWPWRCPSCSGCSRRSCRS